jgi:hypothetical protein
MNAQAPCLLAGLVFLAIGFPPTWGQDVAGRDGSASVVPSSASIPDFSGIWGHAFTTGGLEPPVSGPGPVTNRARMNGVSSIYQLVGDYTNPILKPHAAEEVKKHGQISLTGVAYPTPNNSCWPEPGPYIFRNFGIQLLQQPHQVTILYDEDHEFRRIRMNQSHPEPVTPSWYGDSVGHYEGDSLVVDTVGFRTDRPVAMIDMYGTPYTQALHIVERYRLIDYVTSVEAQERGAKENFRIPWPAEGWAPDPNYRGKGLQLQFTIEDEGVFTTMWSASVTYRRPIATEWPEIACAENPHDFYAAIPRADKPDF